MADPLVPSPQTQPGAATQPRRLGKNINGYFGETIDLNSVLADCEAAARAGGWEPESIEAAPNLQFPAFKRAARHGTGGSPSNTAPEARVYLSTGIHGDEPA